MRSSPDERKRRLRQASGRVRATVGGQLLYQRTERNQGDPNRDGAL